MGCYRTGPPPSHISMGLVHLLWQLWRLWGAMRGYEATLCFPDDYYAAQGLSSVHVSVRSLWRPIPGTLPAPGQMLLGLSNANGIAIDYTLVTVINSTSLQGQILIVDDASPEIFWNGSWSAQDNFTMPVPCLIPSPEVYVNATLNYPKGVSFTVNMSPHANTSHQSSNAGDSFTFQFAGTSLLISGITPGVVGAQSDWLLQMEFTLDGNITTRVFTPGTDMLVKPHFVYFNATFGAATGNHTLVAKVLRTSRIFPLPLQVLRGTISFEYYGQLRLLLRFNTAVRLERLRRRNREMLAACSTRGLSGSCAGDGQKTQNNLPQNPSPPLLLRICMRGTGAQNRSYCRGMEMPSLIGGKTSLLRSKIWRIRETCIVVVDPHDESLSTGGVNHKVFKEVYFEQPYRPDLPVIFASELQGCCTTWCPNLCTSIPGNLGGTISLVNREPGALGAEDDWTRVVALVQKRHAGQTKQSRKELCSSFHRPHREFWKATIWRELTGLNYKWDRPAGIGLVCRALGGDNPLHQGQITAADTDRAALAPFRRREDRDHLGCQRPALTNENEPRDPSALYCSESAKFQRWVPVPSESRWQGKWIEDILPHGVPSCAEQRFVQLTVKRHKFLGLDKSATGPIPKFPESQFRCGRRFGPGLFGRIWQGLPSIAT
ncbi:hypothetical protein B0H19DRAFT_1295707 [Mycena capillaripes]|nr:hypothetical protein B0H19DRAFT_1295707 [Mycena capillaripes]